MNKHEVVERVFNSLDVELIRARVLLKKANIRFNEVYEVDKKRGF